MLSDVLITSTPDLEGDKHDSNIICCMKQRTQHLPCLHYRVLLVCLHIIIRNVVYIFFIILPVSWPNIQLALRINYTILVIFNSQGPLLMNISYNLKILFSYNINTKLLIYMNFIAQCIVGIYISLLFIPCFYTFIKFWN